MGVFDVFQESQTFSDYASSTFWPFVKAYNFADPLKRMCIALFGLDREQCYGTDEQKNSLTDILWDNVSHDGQRGSDSSGRMTAREFMQFFGTNICRRIKDDVWVSLCIKQIKDENPNLALIGDCRFKNEIDVVHEAGGKVIYFTRNSESSDGHDSEKASEYKDHYDCIIDNTNTSVEEQNKLVLEQIQAWGILPKYINM